jgi:phospholipid/cholesterol/gamma-HCH transport system substrate-binding protein
MKSFRDRNPYVVGLVSVLVIGALTGLGFAVGLLHLLERDYQLHGVFADAAGLRVGDKVRLAGVDVGRVIEIRPDHEHGNVDVTWVVGADVELGPETTAEIALETLLGRKYIRLDGPVEEPFLADLPDDERVIPLERTRIPYDIFELNRVGTRSVQALHTEQLNELINQAADITEGRRQSVTELINGLNDVSAAIVARDQELAQLLERTQTLSQTLADKDETLVQLIDASQQILALLADRREELARSLGEGAAAVGELERIIATNQANLNGLLGTLHPTLDVVAANQDSLDTALAWVGPAFYQQTLAGTHGHWLDIYVRDIGTGVPDILCEAFAPGDPNCPQ